MTSGLEAALQSLPHGAEFRFVDRLIELDPGKTGLGEYRLRGDESFFKGHFPGSPLFPGVLLLESLAQLSGIVAQSDPEIEPLTDLRLTAVRSAKIMGSARPGETLKLCATVVGRMGTLIQAEGMAKVGDNVLARAEIVLSGSN